MNSVMLIAGTRPEAIKLSPVIKWLQKLKVDMIFTWSEKHIVEVVIEHKDTACRRNTARARL